MVVLLLTLVYDLYDRKTDEWLKHLVAAEVVRLEPGNFDTGNSPGFAQLLQYAIEKHQKALSDEHSIDDMTTEIRLNSHSIAQI